MAYIGSTSPINAGQTWTSGVQQADRSDRIVGLIKTDQVGTLYIEQSSDGQNWDLSTSNTVTSGTGESFSEEIVAPYFRLRFENTAGSNQGYFRISAKTSSAGDS